MKSLDSNIMILQRDYQLTVESLEQLEIPPLTMKFEKALSIRISLREDIARLGFVNTDAIADYELVRNDFESLNKNTIDLRNAKSKLLTSIETMDDIMVEQFSKTFELVNKQFSETFKTLFRGGTASIVYTDPDNILDSGIEIVARTPGKHVQNLNLYSGGEKSMIALSLIFAIILVKGLPLLLLDEVEAALDEANVERFAKYLTTLNSQSQIIVVSHRPGTMEQADTLFGVTMQNKGITDIVTVKLDDAKQLVD
ncbi:MAG: hypothetical protein DRP42_02080 [Tenericutes bacterium]|nr:MAG: hypothetical protein DRP42_02080 [Mycoplasmatota bacterium]